MKQVLINLMKNSVKFTRSGYIKLSVRMVILKLKKYRIDKATKKKMVASEETSEAIQFEVHDTGVGITSS